MTQDYMGQYIDIKWQEGPVRESGVNGCQIDDVINVLIERVGEVNKFPYQNLWNTETIAYLTLALMAQHHRTIERAERGVEGTSQI